jgi:hypothetical protein
MIEDMFQTLLSTSNGRHPRESNDELISGYEGSSWPDICVRYISFYRLTTSKKDREYWEEGDRYLRAR